MVSIQTHCTFGICAKRFDLRLCIVMDWNIMNSLLVTGSQIRIPVGAAEQLEIAEPRVACNAGIQFLAFLEVWQQQRGLELE